MLRQYLLEVTGFAHAQVARRISQLARWRADQGQAHGACRAVCIRRYTTEDIRLLAEMDVLHGTLSGNTTHKLCELAFKVHGKAHFERLAGISNSYLYNLRQHQTYLPKRGSSNKTRPTKINIGKQRKPFPGGRPGYLRVDSVHQGDLDGIKRMYLINKVDEITQCQAVCAVERISESFLLPVLETKDECIPVCYSGPSQR